MNSWSQSCCEIHLPQGKSGYPFCLDVWRVYFSNSVGLLLFKGFLFLPKLLSSKFISRCNVLLTQLLDACVSHVLMELLTSTDLISCLSYLCCYCCTYFSSYCINKYPCPLKSVTNIIILTHYQIAS